MKNYQNQLDRFRDIAKRLVDEHSAELFINTHLSTNNGQNGVVEEYYSRLDVLGKQLNEQAQQFISAHRTGNEGLRSDIWNTCKKYIDQFMQRNQPQG